MHEMCWIVLPSHVMLSLTLTLREHPKQQLTSYLLLLNENLKWNYGSGITLFPSQVSWAGRVEPGTVPHTSKMLSHHQIQPLCQCNAVTRCKTTCISFANNCTQMFNQFTLYKLTDWGYIRTVFHTHFTPLWWIKMSPPQASPVSSLCIVLCGCLISSSQTAWENSETLSSFDSAPWGAALEMKMGMLLWGQGESEFPHVPLTQSDTPGSL